MSFSAFERTAPAVLSAPGRSLCGCKWVLMWKLGLLLAVCSMGELTQEWSSGQRWNWRVWEHQLVFVRKEDCDHHVMLSWSSFWAHILSSESQYMLWPGITSAQFTLSLCTSVLLLERLLGLGSSWLSPCRAGTYQWEALMVMEKLLQSEARVPTASWCGKDEREEWGKAVLLAEKLLKSFLFSWNSKT